MRGPRAWMLAVCDAIGIGMAGGFYAWVLGGPHPADRAIFQTAQPGLLAGLPSLLATALAAGLVLSVVLGATETSRTWRARLSLASLGLYLACTAAALGSAAQVLGAAASLIALTALALRNDTPESGAVLVTLHAGALGTALTFFEQWTWYRSGWEPFLENLAALKTLWFGG